jgi:alpha/beta superfamily hydrolase
VAKRVCRVVNRHCRQVVDAGFSVLRFDLSGIGDSESRRDVRSGKELAVLDIMDAMDFFTSINSSITSFVLGGLCSGADNTHAAAITDTRIAGCISIDGFAYPTPVFI